jgi:hypothetical protein
VSLTTARPKIAVGARQVFAPRYAAWMLWSVQWAAGPTGYRVMVCNKCRIVRKFYAESLAGESIQEVRQQARDKAIELALKHRVSLDNIIEDREPV